MSRQLTPKQKVFADAYKELGNATRAAKIAYSVKNRNTAAVIGSENLIKPNVVKYLQEQAPQANLMVYRLAMKAKNELVRLRASQDILDRAGYKAPEKRQVDHQVTFTNSVPRPVIRVKAYAKPITPLEPGS